jgi:uncharacterized protein
MAAAADVTWEYLQNIEAVAGCMPGAKITERLAENRYKGTVTVKVGPATMSFRGEVEMKDVDPTTRTLHLLGKGTDSTGSSAASMDLTARVEEAADGLSTLLGTSEVSMSGKAATFGGRMMSAVAEQILKQFADNFAAQVGALQAQRAAAAPAAPSLSSSAVSAVSEAVTQAAGAPAAATPVAAVAMPAPQVVGELNGLALLWGVLKDWLRGLFGKKTV